MCPRCHQNAPLVYRGFNAFCTACGAPRVPLSGASVTLAGQPSKATGGVARVFGWLVLVFGTLLATGTFAACSALVGVAAAAPYLFAVPIAALAWVLSYALFKSGNQLATAGLNSQTAMRTRAVRALANTRGGNVTPGDLAHAVGTTPKEADDHLTAMAKENPDQVSIEVDEQGTMVYRFASAYWQAIGVAETGYAVPQSAHMAPNAGPFVRSRVSVPPPPQSAFGRAEPRVSSGDDASRGEPLEEDGEPEREQALRRSR